jgi:hypothetical protein
MLPIVQAALGRVGQISQPLVQFLCLVEVTRNNLPDGAAPWGFQASVRQMFQLTSLLILFE